MSEFLKHVLKDKVPDSTEIELHLFEFCNLSCSFCGQDHDSEEGLNTVSEKAKQVIDFMQKSGKTSHIVNSMGGEIFNDLVPDETLSQYWDFYTEINDWCINNNHKVRFNWVTNLIFQKSERVLDLITRMRDVSGNAYISTSYDFVINSSVKTCTRIIRYTLTTMFRNLGQIKTCRVNKRCWTACCLLQRIIPTFIQSKT